MSNADATQNADLINRMEISETRISFLEQQNEDLIKRIEVGEVDRAILRNRIEQLKRAVGTNATQKKN